MDGIGSVSSSSQSQAIPSTPPPEEVRVEATEAPVEKVAEKESTIEEGQIIDITG